MFDRTGQCCDFLEFLSGGQSCRIDGQHIGVHEVDGIGCRLHGCTHGRHERESVVHHCAFSLGHVILFGQRRNAGIGGIDEFGARHVGKTCGKGIFHLLWTVDRQGVGEGQKPHMRELLLCLANGDVVHQMPALIEDIVQDADIHVLQVHCKVLCNCIGFRKKSLMHRARSTRIIMPYDWLTVQCVCDFNPFQTRVGENTGAFAVRTGLTDQNFDRNIGIEQHFDLIRHNIDQRIGGRQAGKHGQNGNFHNYTRFLNVWRSRKTPLRQILFSYRHRRCSHRTGQAWISGWFPDWQWH